MKIFKILLTFVVLQSSNIYAYNFHHNKGTASNESLENNTSVLLGCSDSRSPLYTSKMLQPRQHNAVETTPAPTQQEIWKDIPGYEGLYKVSNLGNIKSLKRLFLHQGKRLLQINERILKPLVYKKGYPMVGIFKDGVTKKAYIHRLVAQTFIPNPENKQQVNHKDGNKQNNTASNLEWCTQSENIQHAFKTGLNKSGEEHPFSKLTELSVLEIRSSTLNQRELSEAYGVQQSLISSIKMRKIWKNI